MAAQRFPIPAAYCDPAFSACLHDAIAEPELVVQFCRLYGSNLDNDKRTDEDIRAFSKFVHESIYTRLPDEAIHFLRAHALANTQEA